MEEPINRMPILVCIQDAENAIIKIRKHVEEFEEARSLKNFSFSDMKFLTQTKNKRGEWVPAIPEPLYGVFNAHKCWCGTTTYTYDSYRGHYALKHILGL